MGMILELKERAEDITIFFYKNNEKHSLNLFVFPSLQTVAFHGLKSKLADAEAGKKKI